MTTTALSVYHKLTINDERIAKITRDLDSYLNNPAWVQSNNQGGDDRLEFVIRYSYVLTPQEQRYLKQFYSEWGMLFTVQGDAETVLQLYADAPDVG